MTIHSTATGIKPQAKAFSLPAVLLVVTCSVQAATAAAMEWRYEPRRDSTMVRQTPEQPPVRECEQPPSPVVLPKAEWPEDARTSAHGWQFMDPAVGTGRAESYQDSRTAVKLAQGQQDASLASSAAPPPGLENLPDALQGLNYRIDFGIEYRF
ncbi:hypothetical protein [Marinobacter changyiensis]|uniref:hypothetical protein n=1 Tax=Marinobacter changyiensis TaxID=2604091 RepID=UPI001264F363|nr:hypothetical protein [Marinobacter changyiensis]